MTQPASQDYYALLGVDKQVDAKKLQTAYRKLARQYHPDVNPGNKAAEDTFKRMSAAYEVLSDPAKRKLYDEFGQAGLGPGFDADQARAHQRWQHGRQATGAPFEQEVMDFDLADLFGHGYRKPRGRDLSAVVNIDFAQALRGAEVQFELPSKQALKVRIPKGADHGSVVRVKGQGEAGPAAHGDLVIEIRVRSHPYFRRENLDLFLKLPVTLEEAYHGASVSIPTPDGDVTLRVPPKSQQGTRLRLRGKGVTRGTAVGDLYVDIDARIPDKDDPALAQAMRQTSHGYAKPVREGIHL